MCTCSNVGAYGGAASFSGSGESWMDPAVTTHLIVVCASLQAKPQEKLGACGSKILVSPSQNKYNFRTEHANQCYVQITKLFFVFCKKNLDFGLFFYKKFPETLVFCGCLVKFVFFVGQILNHRIAFILR